MPTHSTNAPGSFHPRVGGTGRPASAISAAADTRLAAADIIAQLEAQLMGAAPTAIVVFASVAHDDRLLASTIGERYPRAQVIGCTSAGEFAEREGSVGGVSAIALPSTTARAAYATLAHFERGTEAGIRDAMARLGNMIGTEPRSLDPKRWVGVVLFDGLHMQEEAANDALGVAAPQLVFVGGSAGDDLQFTETRVFHEGQHTDHGAVLMLLDMAVPFTIVKTCSFEPTEHKFTITRADEANRVVHELDGRPALEVYAKAAGTTPARLDAAVFMTHPVGMMLDGDPWIRSPQQGLPNGGLKFYCQITEGSEVHLMRSTDLVGQTREAIARATQEVGGRAGGIIAFNCILRRLELDARGAHAAFRAAFAGVPTAGFHTYGESYLGHMNQTCTALVFA
jgi:hypothetical protein